MTSSSTRSVTSLASSEKTLPERFGVPLQVILSRSRTMAPSGNDKKFFFFSERHLMPSGTCSATSLASSKITLPEMVGISLQGIFSSSSVVSSPKSMKEKSEKISTRRRTYPRTNTRQKPSFTKSRTQMEKILIPKPLKH